MLVISVINQKGGVGKTTTAVNLAVGLAQAGLKTLLLDLDAQGNAGSGLGVREVVQPGLYEALCAQHQRYQDSVNGGPPAAAGTPAGPGQTLFQTPTAIENLRVSPASPHLAGADVELADNPRRDDLKAVLANCARDAQVAILDTPPSLSILTVNALVAADQLIIPVQCEYYALEGLGNLLRTLEMVKRSLNPELRVLGLVRTMYDNRVGLNREVSAELEQHFPQLIFSTIVPRNVRLAEAPSHGLPIALFDRRSTGADAYRRLVVEVIERTRLKADNSSRPVAATAGRTDGNS